MDWDAIKPLLNAKLDPARVRRKPSGSYGPKGDYIEGWHAIAEANRIFGFGAWSYEIASLTQADLRETQKNGQPQWQAAYVCTVRLAVGGAVREDVGFGSGFAKQIGDAIEGAAKEAVTDALKRTLRTFGNPFGLALYDKSGANVGPPEPAPESVRDRLKAAALGKATPADLEAFVAHPQVAAALAGLPEPMQQEIRATIRDRHAALTGEEAI